MCVCVYIYIYIGLNFVPLCTLEPKMAEASTIWAHGPLGFYKGAGFRGEGSGSHVLGLRVWASRLIRGSGFSVSSAEMAGLSPTLLFWCVTGSDKTCLCYLVLQGFYMVMP